MLSSAVLALCAVGVNADLYLHSFRGSNNRLDEANRDRANANRLFDSQNNNRGGYNAGTVYYTVGSKTYFQWTNQHSCGTNQNDCELVWQYMCDDNLRDGTSTKRIPYNNNQCYMDDCENDLEYGRQESRDWYYQCMATKRNKGLFTANQNLNNRNDARYTRQNPNGNRYGYECPEERDYYPYWRPTPWIDMAVMTNSPTRCAEYQAKSENVLGRWYCKVPPAMYAMQKAATKVAWIPINEKECNEMWYLDEATSTVYNATWTQAPSHGKPAPECFQNRKSRDNHLGSGEGGYMNSYNWTVPDFNSETCAFRVRYNITTSEYPAWKDAFSTEVGTVDWRNNSGINVDPNRDPANLAIYEKYGFEYTDVVDSFNRATNNNAATLINSREYVFKNNPKVDIFGHTLIPSSPGKLKLQLNINTNQFGRTFQDRSHRFAVRPAAAECLGTTVHNLQVRGKRGNVVQTYPGMEYDFVPDRLDLAVGECVHIQWTGSNTNPNNNDGQGKQGTDRSNIVLLADKVYQEDGQPSSYMGQFGRSFPNHIRMTSFLGLSDEDEQRLAILDQEGGEMSELDDAATYFDLGVRKVTVAGIFHYLCTRNNNFSNRSQKGKVVAASRTVQYASVGWNGGTASAATGTTVTVPQATFTVPVELTLETWPASAEATKEWLVVSDYVKVFLSQEGQVNLAIPYANQWSVNGHSVYYNPSTEPASLDPKSEGWVEMEGMVFDNAMASGKVSGSGVYVVTEGPIDLALAVMLPLITLVAVGVFVFLYHKHTKGELDETLGDVKEFFITKV